MTERPTPTHPLDLLELSAYLDGELNAEARQRVAAHLGICPACAARYAQLRSLAAGLRALPEVTLGFDLASVIEGRLAAAPRPPAARRSQGWRARWPLAFGAAASLAIGVSMGSALVAGGAAMAPPMVALHVFDALPPGNLCIGLDSCYVNGSLK